MTYFQRTYSPCLLLDLLGFHFKVPWFSKEDSFSREAYKILANIRKAVHTLLTWPWSSVSSSSLSILLSVGLILGHPVMKFVASWWEEWHTEYGPSWKHTLHCMKIEVPHASWVMLLNHVIEYTPWLFKDGVPNSSFCTEFPWLKGQGSKFLHDLNL